MISWERRSEQAIISLDAAQDNPLDQSVSLFFLLLSHPFGDRFNQGFTESKVLCGLFPVLLNYMASQINLHKIS